MNNHVPKKIKIFNIKFRKDKRKYTKIIIMIIKYNLLNNLKLI